MKTLIINAQPYLSNTESFSNKTLEYLKSKITGEFTQVDLETLNAPRLNENRLKALNKMMQGEKLTDDEAKIQEKSDDILNQFLEHDNIIIVSPLYNLSITSQLKDYIDNLIITGKTVKYTENGPQGLLEKTKPVRYVQACGSIYSTGQEPYSKMNNAPTTIESIFNFLGIENVDTIFVEGTGFMPKDEILNKMKSQMDELIKELNI